MALDRPVASTRATPGKGRTAAPRRGLEIPPNQSSSARIAVPRGVRGGGFDWRRMWAWLGTSTLDQGIPPPVEACFSGDKIP